MIGHSKETPGINNFIGQVNFTDVERNLFLSDYTLLFFQITHFSAFPRIFSQK
jgi:hypothetical protein